MRKTLLLAVLASSLPAGRAAPAPMDTAAAFSWNQAAAGTTPGYSNGPLQQQQQQQHEFGAMATPFAAPILPFDPFRVNPNAAAAAVRVQHEPHIPQGIPIASSYSHASSYGSLPAASSYNSFNVRHSSGASLDASVISAESPAAPISSWPTLGGMSTSHAGYHSGAQVWTSRESEARRILAQMNARRLVSSMNSPLVQLNAAPESRASIDVASLKRALDEMTQPATELSESSSQLLGTSPKAKKLLELLQTVRSTSDAQKSLASESVVKDEHEDSPTFFQFDPATFGNPSSASVASGSSVVPIVDTSLSRSYLLESLLDEVATGDTGGLPRVLSYIMAMSSMPIINEIGRDGYGLLHVAAMAQAPRNIAILIEYGADVNLADARGLSPIAYVDDVTTAMALLNLGATVPRGDRSTGGTLLHSAVLLQNVPFLKALLARKSGRDAINDVNANGDTALHMAARLGKANLAEFLVQTGASVTVTNDQQAVPVEEAARAGHVYLVEWLLRHHGMPRALHEKLVKGVSIAHSCQLLESENPWPSIIPLKERPPKRDTITTSELIQYMTLPRLSAKCRTILRTTLPVNAVPDVVFILRLGLDEVVHAFVPVGDGTLYRHGMFVLIESADPKRLSIDVAEIIAINQGHMHTMRSNNTPLRRIFRPLTASELASLDEKRIIETHDFELIKNSMNDWTWLPEENLQVVGLRYQWDKRRAVVYFHSSKMVQFKKLLFKLSSILKTRVHMVPTDGSFVPVRPAHDGIGK